MYSIYYIHYWRFWLLRNENFSRELRERKRLRLWTETRKETLCLVFTRRTGEQLRNRNGNRNRSNIWRSSWSLPSELRITVPVPLAEAYKAAESPGRRSVVAWASLRHYWASSRSSGRELLQRIDVFTWRPFLFRVRLALPLWMQLICTTATELVANTYYYTNACPFFLKSLVRGGCLIIIIWNISELAYTGAACSSAREENVWTRYRLISIFSRDEVVPNLYENISSWGRPHSNQTLQKRGSFWPIIFHFWNQTPP